MMRRHAVLLMIVMALAATLVGCPSSPKGGGGVTPDPNEPAWVAKGSGIYPGDKGRAIYAVGIANHEPNERMMWTVAQVSARTELANQLEVYVANLVKDFMQSHRDYATGEGSSIQFTSSVSKSITAKTLHGSQRIDAYRNPQTKTLYVLYTMPVGEALKQAKKDVMAAARQKAAETFKAKADEAIAELDKELDKRAEAEAKMAQ